MNKFIFVCSPYRPISTDHKDAELELAKNIYIAKKACKKIACDGNIPYAPHLFAPQFLNDADSKERQLGIEIGLYMLEKADIVWVIGDQISEGMAKEIEFAEMHNIPVLNIPIDML